MKTENRDNKEREEVIYMAPERTEEVPNLIAMLFRHEDKIRNMESDLSKLNESAINTNHHLANMRISLQMLKPITESVEEIAEAAKENKKEIEDQKKSHAHHRKAVETDVHYMKERIESIGPWIKWGVATMVGMSGIFFTAATALKLFN